MIQLKPIRYVNSTIYRRYDVNKCELSYKPKITNIYKNIISFHIEIISDKTYEKTSEWLSNWHVTL